MARHFLKLVGADAPALGEAHLVMRFRIGGVPVARAGAIGGAAIGRIGEREHADDRHRLRRLRRPAFAERVGEDDPLEWRNSRRVASIEEVAAVKASDGPDLLIQGSTTLYPALFAAGLVDRLFVMTFPVVLGAGKRLFGPGTPPFALRLVEHRVSTTGVTIATYEPAGAVPIGDFQLSEPSEREKARQERMKREG